VTFISKIAFHFRQFLHPFCQFCIKIGFILFMIELRTPIAHGLVDPIEEWCNGLQRCPWGISSDAAGAAYQLFGFFDDAATAHAAWKDLRDEFPALPGDAAETTLDDRDWREAYKAHLRPWSADDLHWVPVWLQDEYPLPAGHTRLLFDAGMAFGTGDHATTRLMARRLLDFRAAHGLTFPAARIIDAGCGSGILALSAALLGAKHVFAFDRDPEAIAVSRENLAANGLPPGAVEFSHAAIEAALHGRCADLLLANIQADVLAIHADDFVNAIAPGGVLAMSGILAAEVNELRATIAPVFAELWKFPAPADSSTFGDSRVLGDWCDLVFQRPTD
jgi:ribosomal protein L11 methyltransferase